MNDLCQAEIELLETMNGDRPSEQWGAWVTVALEGLCAHQFVAKQYIDSGINYVVTESGKQFLANRAQL